MKKIILGVLLSILSLSADGIYATFSVEATQDANLAFIASGIVKSVDADVGSKVKKGQVIASLENSDRKAMLEIAKTALKFAKKDYERQLKIKNLLDEAKFDGVAYKYENAKNQLAYQQTLYDKTFLKAPFDGVIYSKNIEVGDAVSGVRPQTVFQLQSQEQRKLLLEFDQKYRNSVKVGDIFHFSVDGDKRSYDAAITKIYPRANTQNRKIRAEVAVKNFMPALFGDGYIQLQRAK